MNQSVHEYGKKKSARVCACVCESERLELHSWTPPPFLTFGANVHSLSSSSSFFFRLACLQASLVSRRIWARRKVISGCWASGIRRLWSQGSMREKLHATIHKQSREDWNWNISFSLSKACQCMCVSAQDWSHTSAVERCTALETLSPQPL